MDGIWEEIHKKMTWGEYPPEHVIRFVARNYYRLNRKQIRILDFGCGQGANTWYLAREGFDTYAFDGSENAVLKCKEKLRKEDLTANIKVSDGIFIDYPSDYFDAVIDNACIYANEIININSISRVYLQLRSIYTDSGNCSCNTSTTTLNLNPQYCYILNVVVKAPGK